MRERREGIGTTQDGGSANASRSLASNQTQTTLPGVGEEFDLSDWGSASALAEKCVPMSGAHALSVGSSREPAGTAARLSTSSPKVLPPRPAPSPMAPKVPLSPQLVPERSSGWHSDASPAKVRGFSAEPPTGSTQAYDHAELERLLQASDRGVSSIPPPQLSTAESVQTPKSTTSVAAPGGSNPTQPEAKAESRAADSLFPRWGDTIHDAEDATTAYLRPSAVGESSLSLGDQQRWATVAVAGGAGEAKSSAAAAAENGARGDPSVTPMPESANRMPTGAAIARNSLAPTRQARKSTVARLVWGFIAVGSIGMGVALWANSEMSDRVPATGVRRGAWEHFGAWLSPPEPVPRAPSQLIQLEISVDPTHAQLYLDGHEASNPLKISYPADGAVHDVSAVAPGYQTRKHRVRFDRDVTVLFGLTPLPAPHPPPNE